MLVLPAAQAEAAIHVLRRLPGTAGATVAGRIGPGRNGRVSLRTRLGTSRHVPMLSGAQLPRIC
jgi:hydrogenase maturation factor